MIIGLLIIGLPLSALASAVLYLPFFLRGRKYKMPAVRHLACYALTVMLALIIFVTLLAGGITFFPDYRLLNLQPFVWVSQTYEMGFARMIQQLVSNILMFVPLGVLMPIVFPKLRSFWRLSLCALGITVLIEITQYFTGRSADIDDVIMNTVGGMLGFGIYAGFNRLLRGKSWWRKATVSAAVTARD